MLRIFIRLWIFVIIPLVLISFTTDYNPVQELRRKLEVGLGESYYRGTFYMLFNELERRPQAEWPAYIESINPHFDHRLMLVRIDDLQDGARAKRRLNAGKYYIRDEPPKWLMRRIGDSDYVLSFALAQTPDQELRRDSMGAVYMIEEHLKQFPQEQWPAAIAALQPHYGFPMAVLEPHELQLTAEQRAQLMNLGYVAEKNEPSYMVLNKLLPGGRKVLHAGPITDGGAEIILLVGAFVMVSLYIAAGLFLWLRPFWRDLRQMNKVSAEFGAGDFNARVTVKKSSALLALAESFNNMAAGIQKLIDGHKELVNAVSHDLRTPLSKVRFALEMLEEETVPENRDRYIHNIKHGIKSLEDLINQLLIHARFDRAPGKGNFGCYDLQELLQEEVELLNDTGAPVFVEFTAIAGGGEFVFDRGAMVRAVGNLLQNALQYARNRVVLALSIEAGDCIISVDDDGPGIRPADRERIFQPFTRLDNNARSAQQGQIQGHGLGLAIVKQIARWHQGSVSVTDSPLGGARFILRWPAKTAL
jgi:two-component system sensor histidine kinase RstB